MFVSSHLFDVDQVYVSYTFIISFDHFNWVGELDV